MAVPRRHSLPEGGPARANAGSRVALFFPSSTESLLTSLLPLALAARQRYGVEPVVILIFPDEVATARLNDAGIAYSVLPQELVQDRLPQQMAQNANDSRIFGLRDVGSTLRWISSQWGYIRRGKREAEAIFQRYHPCAIFQVMESPFIELFVNRVARRRGVPTVLLQWALTSPRVVDAHYHRDQYKRRLDRIPDVLHPLYLARRTVGRKLLRLLYRLHGIRHGRSLGDGNAQFFAVMNPSSVLMFRQQGVPSGKLVCTGHPEDDVLYAYHQRYSGPSERAQGRREFGLDPEKHIIVYAREAVFPDGFVDRETDHSLIRAVLNVATHQPNAQVVLKLHPRDTAEYYEWVGSEFPEVARVHRCDFYKLLAVSDVFLSQGSSTTRWALVLEKPAVLIGWARFEFTRVAAAQFGLKPVNSADELDQQLRYLLAGGDTPLTPQIETLRSQVDGKATRRILELAGLTPRPSGPLEEWQRANPV